MYLIQDKICLTTICLENTHEESDELRADRDGVAGAGVTAGDPLIRAAGTPPPALDSCRGCTESLVFPPISSLLRTFHTAPLFLISYLEGFSSLFYLDEILIFQSESFAIKRFRLCDGN